MGYATGALWGLGNNTLRDITALRKLRTPAPSSRVHIFISQIYPSYDTWRVACDSQKLGATKFSFITSSIMDRFGFAEEKPYVIKFQQWRRIPTARVWWNIANMKMTFTVGASFTNID